MQRRACYSAKKIPTTRPHSVIMSSATSSTRASEYIPSPMIYTHTHTGARGCFSWFLSSFIHYTSAGARTSNAIAHTWTHYYKPRRHRIEHESRVPFSLFTQRASSPQYKLSLRMFKSIRESRARPSFHPPSSTHTHTHTHMCLQIYTFSLGPHVPCLFFVFLYRIYYTLQLAHFLSFTFWFPFLCLSLSLCSLSSILCLLRFFTSVTPRCVHI